MPRCHSNDDIVQLRVSEGRRTIEIDLCAKHRERYVTPLFDNGRTPRKPRKTSSRRYGRLVADPGID